MYARWSSRFSMKVAYLSLSNWSPDLSSWSFDLSCSSFDLSCSSFDLSDSSLALSFLRPFIVSANIALSACKCLLSSFSDILSSLSSSTSLCNALISARKGVTTWHQHQHLSSTRVAVTSYRLYYFCNRRSKWGNRLQYRTYYDAISTSLRNAIGL